MTISVLANINQFEELTKISDNVKWIHCNDFSDFKNDSTADCFFNLLENACLEDYSFTQKPVFINSVVHTLQEKNHSINVIRFNGWNGFINRTNWEIAGILKKQDEDILSLLSIKASSHPDTTGFTSARIIAMIINEAYLAKEEHVSTEDEIDIAMKLGTNYPKGPFEWAKEIGLKNVYELLYELSTIDARYKPAASIKKLGTI